MAEPFIFMNTYKIKPGMEAEYRKAFQEITDIVEAKEPKMLYFASHISEEGTEATTVQVHADAENMAFHMEQLGDHIRAAARVLDFSSQSIQIYGTPTDALLEQMRELAGSGVPVTISRAAIGFDRFSSS